MGNLKTIIGLRLKAKVADILMDHESWIPDADTWKKWNCKYDVYIYIDYQAPEFAFVRKSDVSSGYPMIFRHFELNDFTLKGTILV